MEFERLRNVEAKYVELQVQFMTVRIISRQLAEESKKLNDVEPNLTTKIHELENVFRQNETEEAERRQCLSRQQFKIQATLLSSVAKEANSEPIDLLSSFGKEANSMAIDRRIESSHTDIQYTDEVVQDFIEKLIAGKEKSRVDFPDFKGLTKELGKSRRVNLPPSLVPIDEILKKAHGDITAESNQSTPLIRDSHILFCSVIKEMNELQLEQIDLNKMILWRDAINSGLNIGFKGNFAIERLKRIARAYFGSKARNDPELKSMEERISELKAELYALEKKHSGIAEKQGSKMRRECLLDQEYFQGKPLSTGLFLC